MMMAITVRITNLTRLTGMFAALTGFLASRIVGLPVKWLKRRGRYCFSIAIAAGCAIAAPPGWLCR
jgi:hypothetical protein